MRRTGFTDQEKLSQELLIRQFEDDQDAAEFKEWEMPVTQMDGIYSTYPELVAELSFTTEKDYDDWIARLHAIPQAFDQVTQNMDIGMKDGRVPPQALLEEALAQVTTLAHQKPEDSPLAAPLKKFPASISPAEQERIKAEMLEVIGKEDLPAYLRFERFMKVSYVPAGRTDPCICALPDGARYYQFLIRRVTASKLTPEQIHQIGLDEVKKDEAEELAIAQKLGFKDLASFRASLKTNPKLHPASAEALLDAYRGFLAPMEAKLPQLFGVLPKEKFEVAAVPDVHGKDRAARLLRSRARPTAAVPAACASTPTTPPRAISTRWRTSPITKAFPAIICRFPSPRSSPAFRSSANTKATRRMSRAGPSTPSTWARMWASTPTPTRITAVLKAMSGAPSAWWSIPACTPQHWTRQQMVDYFHQHSSIDETSIQSEVDRYIAWPGQALAYKIGQLKILELRARAEKDSGPEVRPEGFSRRRARLRLHAAGHAGRPR